MSLLPLGITMGCPCGIGPEIIIKNYLYAQSTIPYIVLGDLGILQKAATLLGAEVTFHSWQVGTPLQNGALNVFPLSSIAEHGWGAPTVETGKAMAGYIIRGVELIQENVLSGIVTCPIAKTTLNAAGYNYPGHTEMLEALSGGTNVAMMMAGDKLKVTLVTLHMALSNVPSALSVESVLQMIQTTHKALSIDFGIENPSIAIAALNPHAGEDGLFGDEEGRILAPAIKLGREQGVQLSDPMPPDTVFFKAAAGHYDAVVCMYHDQGLIPFKLLHFEDGVNVTLGLSIVRTSVDHGTAYDIAGTGKASHTSLQSALSMAQQIVSNRQKYNQN